MTTISATPVDHQEPEYPAHWVHFELDRPLVYERHILGGPPFYFRDLVVSHQMGFLGEPETVLLPSDRAGQPLPMAPLRTVQDRHTEPAELVRHYLTRHAEVG